MKKPHYRQGDILVQQIESLPKTAVLQEGPCILAHGKVTGHNHQILSGATRHIDGETQYIEVTEDSADLIHDEHGTITLPRGSYQVIRQREYTPEAIRNVED